MIFAHGNGALKAIGDPQLLAQAESLIAHRVAEILKAHGPTAFESPRSIALAHETGHAILAGHDKRPMSRIRVWTEKQNGKTQWTGEVNTPKWRLDPTSSPFVDLNIACQISAGLMGEMVYDTRNCRAGSSLDEMCVAQLVTSCGAQKLGLPDKHVWEVVRLRTGRILHHNRSVASKIMKRLDKTLMLRGASLHALLAEVKPTPDADYQTILDEMAR